MTTARKASVETRTVTGVLTRAQLENLHAAPVEVVVAVAGQWPQPRLLLATSSPGPTPYTTADGASLTLSYKVGETYTDLIDLDPALLVGATDPQGEYLVVERPYPVALSRVRGASLVFRNLVTPLEAGEGTLAYELRYESVAV